MIINFSMHKNEMNDDKNRKPEIGIYFFNFSPFSLFFLVSPLPPPKRRGIQPFAVLPNSQSVLMRRPSIFFPSDCLYASNQLELLHISFDNILKNDSLSSNSMNA